VAAPAVSRYREKETKDTAGLMTQNTVVPAKSSPNDLTNGHFPQKYGARNRQIWAVLSDGNRRVGSKQQAHGGDEHDRKGNSFEHGYVVLRP
jgi:hypothetical protein